DKNPQAMRQRRETVEHPFGTLKMRMGATHFLMKRLPKVATEMALHVLAYNLTRVMNIMGIQPLMAAIRAWPKSGKTARVATSSSSVLLQENVLTRPRSKPALRRCRLNVRFARKRPIKASLFDHLVGARE